MSISISYFSTLLIINQYLDNGNLKITKKDRLKITNYGE